MIALQELSQERITHWAIKMMEENNGSLQKTIALNVELARELSDINGGKKIGMKALRRRTVHQVFDEAERLGYP